MRQLKNYTEDRVKQYVNSNIAGVDVCQCDDCRLDIMAIMLNQLPAHYVVTDVGAIFAQLHQFEEQSSVDVTIAMAEAVKIVKKEPRHE